MDARARKPRRWPFWALFAVIVLVLSGSVLWLALNAARPTPWEKPAVVVDERRVELRHTDSACQTGESVDVEESDTEVVLTVEQTQETPCNDDGRPHTAVVELQRPLGDRRLVDGACEEEVYADAPDCLAG